MRQQSKWRKTVDFDTPLFIMKDLFRRLRSLTLSKGQHTLSSSKHIRKLEPRDAIAFASLRLDATKANPECFCSSINELQKTTVDYFAKEIEQRHQLTNNLVIGYFQQNKLVGTIGVEQLHGDLRKHKSRIWGLMVLPECRRQGVARALCETAIDQAKAFGADKLGLELTGEAVAALQLYRSLGFRIETIEPMALKLEGRYMDEIRMAICF